MELFINTCRTIGYFEARHGFSISARTVFLSANYSAMIRLSDFPVPEAGGWPDQSGQLIELMSTTPFLSSLQPSFSSLLFSSILPSPLLYCLRDKEEEMSSVSCVGASYFLLLPLILLPLLQSTPPTLLSIPLFFLLPLFPLLYLSILCCQSS